MKSPPETPAEDSTPPASEGALDEIERAVRRVVCAELRLDEGTVTAETRLLDVGASSIKMLRVVAKIEKEYGIELDDDVLFRVETARDLAIVVAAARAAARRGSGS